MNRHDGSGRLAGQIAQAIYDRRTALGDPDTRDEFVKGVILVNKKEGTASSAGQVTHAALFTGMTLRRKWQTLNNQRVQVVFQYHIFKVTVELDDR